MYLLRFLDRDLGGVEGDKPDTVRVEYRLACSGELYNRRVVTTDWRKSDTTRVLLREPLELFVASQPFAAYPQELCLRMAVSRVTEQENVANISASSSFLPDEDIVEDLCSILSLLSRRLVSLASKTREQYSDEQPALGSYGSDRPIPLLQAPYVAVWTQRPATASANFEGPDNSPPPVGVDPQVLTELLLRLAEIPQAMEIVYASRLYRTALELIESRPDIAYQLLISTVESLAAVALGDYEPEDSDKLAMTLAVQERARHFGLDEDRVRQLGLEACKGQRWLKKKFKKFLLDFVSLEILAEKDRVFLVPEHLCPPPDNFGETLGRIYDVRSGNLHAALPFPRSVGIGISPQIKWRNLPVNPLTRPPVPPVTWFERVVSTAARKFLLDRALVKSAPFLEYGSPGDAQSRDSESI